MKLSKKTKYALKAMLLLAREYKQGPLLISDVAKREKIPRKFLEAILLTLKNRGLLQSKKGKGGGYFLDTSPTEVSIGSIVRIFEGPLAPTACASENAYTACAECNDDLPCGVRLVMQDVRNAIAHILDGTSLSDVIDHEDQMRKNRDGMLMYEI